MSAPPSFPLTRECEFTFQAQHFPDEYLGRGLIVQTLPGSVIIGPHPLLQQLVGQSGAPEQGTTQPAKAVFPSALLPGRVGIAEVGGNALVAQAVMPGELGAIVKGDALPRRGRQAAQDLPDSRGDGFGGLAFGQSPGQHQPGAALVQSQHGLTVGG